MKCIKNFVFRHLDFHFIFEKKGILLKANKTKGKIFIPKYLKYASVNDELLSVIKHSSNIVLFSFKWDDHIWSDEKHEMKHFILTFVDPVKNFFKVWFNCFAVFTFLTIQLGGFSTYTEVCQIFLCCSLGEIMED